MQVDRPEWVADLRRAVDDEVDDLDLHRSVEVAVVEGAICEGSNPAVAIVLLGPSSREDVGLTSWLSNARDAGLLVIPVVDDLRMFAAQAPDGVAQLNGFEWSGNQPARRLARLLLEELGIEDRDRRLFISHRRSDGLGAAGQLHDELSHHQFVPFVDRWAIPKGADVQGHIADSLEHHAFLLLLETPDAHRSDWVYLEVDYALSHTMGLLIIQWPGNPTPLPGSQGVPRVELGSEDLVTDSRGYEILTTAALERLVPEIEAAHARGIARRRRMLVRSVEDAARASQRNATMLRDWSLDIGEPGDRTIVAVVPRLPTTADLHRLDQIRDAADPNADALLVHASRHLPLTERDHLLWVTGDRNLQLVSQSEMESRWLT